MKQYLLQTESLSKSFGKIEVLHDIESANEQREVYGLIGQNGAGKTTLLCLMSGLMKPSKGTVKKITLFAIAIIMIAALSGCGSNDDTIQRCVISNTSYTTQDELKSATQPETLSHDESVYASIHFVESPKGMEYTVKWYLDSTEVKSETKATANDTQDIVVFELETEQIKESTLKFEVIYKDTILLTKELNIQ